MQFQGVFIDGAPGIGKTILAIEAANKLRRDNRHVLVAYIDCKNIKSFESFAGTVIEQICRSPPVDDPAAEIKNRIMASKDFFYILFLDNFEYYVEAALRCSKRVKSFIGEIARCATNIKFLVTSSETVCFLRTMKPVHLIPFTDVESSKLVEKVHGEKISDRQFKILCEICSGIPLVLHTLTSQLDLICLLDHFEPLIAEEVTKFLEKMKAVPEEGKIEACLDFCFQRLKRQVQLTLLRLCLYRGLFTPGKAAKIFRSSEPSEHDLRDNVLELGRRNLLHQQKSQDTIKYTFLTII